MQEQGGEKSEQKCLIKYVCKGSTPLLAHYELMSCIDVLQSIRHIDSVVGWTTKKTIELWEREATMLDGQFREQQDDTIQNLPQ